MNVSTSNNVAQQQQQQAQQDQTDLYTTNNFNHLNNLVSTTYTNSNTNSMTLVQQPQISHQIQQQQLINASVDNVNFNLSENENDSNNNSNLQLINDLKQQHNQQQQQQNLVQMNMNLVQQGSYQVILEQNDLITNNNLPIQQLQQQQQQPPQQQAKINNQPQRFRIVKTDGDTNSDSSNTRPVTLNGVVDLNNTNEIKPEDYMSNQQLHQQQVKLNNQYQTNLNLNQAPQQLNGALLVNGINLQSNSSYHRGRWLVTDSDNAQLRSINNGLQSVNLINQPVLNTTILNNSNTSNNPITIVTNSNLSCALADDQPTANMYSNIKETYVYGTVNSNDNSKEQIQINQNSVTSTSTTSSTPSTTTTTTLPHSHFNPINPTIDQASFYATQQVYQPNQSQITNPTNITIKPVPMVPIISATNTSNANIPQKVILNTAPSTPTPTPSQPVVSTQASNTIGTDAIVQNVNNLVGQMATSASSNSAQTSSTSSSGPPSNSSTTTNLSTTSGIVSNVSTSTPTTTNSTASSNMMSTIKEKLQNNLETIQLTQTSINSVNIVSNNPIKPFTNPQQQKQDANIQDQSNDSTYNQTNAIHNLNEQASNSNLLYQSQPVYEVLNVNVSTSTSSNSDYIQSSPKEQLHQNAAPSNTNTNNSNNTSVQIVNNNLSNQSSSSITGNNTPPVTNPGSTSSTSSSAIIDQTLNKLSREISDPEGSLTEKSNDNDKSSIDNDKGIKSRIELAMDLVKTHLTSAVNQEILSLKSQIEKLTEKCSRLEQENQILRKHAQPETLALIENRSSGLITNQSSSNSINIQSNGMNLTSSTQISVNDHSTHSTYISEPIDSAKTNNSLLLTTAVDKIQDFMTNSMTEHILNNNIDPITTHSTNLYEYDSLNNHNIHNSDESIMNSNETKS